MLWAALLRILHIQVHPRTVMSPHAPRSRKVAQETHSRPHVSQGSQRGLFFNGCEHSPLRSFVDKLSQAHSSSER